MSIIRVFADVRDCRLFLLGCDRNRGRGIVYTSPRKLSLELAGNKFKAPTIDSFGLRYPLFCRMQSKQLSPQEQTGTLWAVALIRLRRIMRKLLLRVTEIPSKKRDVYFLS